MSSIKNKLLLVMLLVSVLPLLVLGLINFFKISELTTASIQSQLETIVKIKNDALEQYISNTEVSARSLGATPAFAQYLEIANSDIGSVDQARLAALKGEISDLLYAFQRSNWGRYHHVFLIDRSQRIVVSPNKVVAVPNSPQAITNTAGSPSSHLNEDTSLNRWATEAFNTGLTTVSDYSSWVESDHNHQMLFYPLKGQRGRVEAVLGFELQIPYEQEILQSNVELGEAGKIFLATTDGIPIVYKGFEDQEKIYSSGFRDLRDKNISSERRPNADGVEVIDIYLKNEKYPWVLVAEIETKQVFAGLYTIQWIMLVGLVLTLIVALLLATSFAGTIVKPINELTQWMDRVSHGELNHNVDEKGRSDEIGAMIKSFNRLIASLKVLLRKYQTQRKESPA
jgi:HAMP domain-containing protein